MEAPVVVANVHQPASRPPVSGLRSVAISIITSTLNAERFLPACAQAVREQAGAGFTVEHVVVDGGSRDRTVEIARSYGCVVLEGRDAGVYDAQNKGIRAASGDIFACLGADDALAPGALSAVARWFNHRRSDWVVGGCRWINSESRTIGSMLQLPKRIPREVYASLGWNCIPTTATYMTRDFFERLGGYDASFRIMGDYKVFSEALDVQPYDRVARVLSIVRLHRQSVSAASGSSVLSSERERIADAYGPRSRVLRQIYRQGLRVWLNAREPAWFVGKRLFAPCLS
jgi:glycosyltransferase involved in cell wall biosynthesis